MNLDVRLEPAHSSPAAEELDSRRARLTLRGAREYSLEVETDFTFEEPWETTGGSPFLKEQIEAELTPPHPLHGKVVRTLAIRADSDDVLVKTTDGYALVHLSWCRRSQPSPDFPHTRFLDDWESFLDQVYEPDVSAWLEEHPTDDWDLIIREASEGA